MSDNYLWDRSGEADPEIQQLEEILGPLRYQPRPLDIPAHIQIGRRRTFSPWLAIAAAIALLAIGLGLWINFKRQTVPPLDVASNPPVQVVAPAPNVAPSEPPQDVAAADPQRAEPKRQLAVYRPRETRNVIRHLRLTPEELAEKEKVLVALRLVSAKLNVAQRKAQHTSSPDTIRNQHRIG